MKRLIPFIVTAAVLIMPASAGAQITNPGFESWTNGMPDGWYTYTSVYNDITKSTSAHSGTASLKASVVLVKNVPVGSYLQAGSGAQGFPVTQRYAALSGYYQFVPTGGDHFTVTVIMYAGTAPVGHGTLDAASYTGARWTLFTVPITYTAPEIPETISIQVAIAPSSSSSAPHAGSYYQLDDLSLVVPTAVENAPASAPAEFALGQNFPNPFNPSTTIQFSLPVRSHVSLKVFNALGEEVAVLSSEELAAGSYTRQWNAEGCPSGVYYYRVQAGAFSETKRMLLLR
ncbi:MAG: T9SS type A sorting domain-containing protein [Acidobacteriota bacterium]